MWIIEAITAVGAVLLIMGAPWRKGGPRALPGLLLAVAAGLALIVLFDPLRWQLWPLFVLIALGLVLGLWRWRRGQTPRAWWVRGIEGIVALGLAAIAALPLLVFPTFDLPRPSGPMKVGVTDLAVTDPAREDPYFGGKREVAVRAWYPTTEEWDGPIAPYQSAAFSRNVIFGPLKSFMFGHLHLVGTQGYRDAPVNGTNLPVVVFVHGYNAFISQNTALAQDLASHGYVVLSVGMPGDAVAVEFPDGRIKEFKNPRFLANTGPLYEVYPEMHANPPPERVLELVRQVMAKSPVVDEALRVQVKDVRHLLDLVERGGLGKLDGHLDAGRIALSGQSFGGSVSGQACFEDPRCKAAVNLDGMQFGDLVATELGKPVLFMENGDQTGPWLNDMSYRAPRRPANAPDVIYLRVRGAKHVDYADFTLASPFLKRHVPNQVLGTIDGGRMLALTSDSVLAFLDQHLRGQPARLEGVVDKWPEVIRRRPEVPEGWDPN
ncbi:alpha/beta hydrolase family protein [Erythrobacter sp. NE805]|uniref:alpha/beta hydrolase family protein n=1 Tax=Erythrobacter sp. NE805 TaxID=3389875 RepID=UPI00396B1447